MSAHTPGPWGLIKSETGPWAVFGEDGSWVATTCKRQWKTEDTANARIMSASIDMLQALKWAVENPTDDAYWIAQAKAAIAKAEGKP
ncbi:MAG: hypothetical protein KGI54_15335 [Pseudomonadota bacterium]|nr:hypothetical protein [Pseudomonadota bacterium]